MFQKMKESKLSANKAVCKAAKKKCKITINQTKEAEQVKVCRHLEEADEKGELFRMVKQMKKARTGHYWWRLYQRIIRSDYYREKEV